MAEVIVAEILSEVHEAITNSNPEECSSGSTWDHLCTHFNADGPTRIRDSNFFHGYDVELFNVEEQILYLGNKTCGFLGLVDKRPWSKKDFRKEYMQYYGACSRRGKPEPPRGSGRLKNRRSPKCDCKASFTLRFDEGKIDLSFKPDMSLGSVDGHASGCKALSNVLVTKNTQINKMLIPLAKQPTHLKKAAEFINNDPGTANKNRSYMLVGSSNSNNDLVGDSFADRLSPPAAGTLAKPETLAVKAKKECHWLLPILLKKPDEMQNFFKFTAEVRQRLASDAESDDVVKRRLEGITWPDAKK